jgi:thymidine phosphorylase
VGPTETPLARVHAASEEDAEQAAANLRAACTVQDTAPAPQPVIRGRLPAG